MSEDCWGPWINHIPGPCPEPVGVWIEVETYGGDCMEGRLIEGAGEGGREHPAFTGVDLNGFRHECHPNMICHYRVRRPGGMAVLRKALTNLPIKETADA